MHEMPLEAATWLVSRAGLAAVAEAAGHLDAGGEALAAVTALRAGGLAPEQAAAAVTAASARLRARARWPAAERLLFTTGGLEQASDPALAAWRARRFTAVDPGQQVWDLCAGVGGDALALASAGAEVVCVERDPARAVLLRHNLAASGLTARVEVADALAVSLPDGAWLYADPSRRHRDRRARSPAEYEPALGALLQAHADVAGAGVAVAPGVGPEAFELAGRTEVEYVQLGGALVEATAWLGGLREPDVVASATLLPEGLHRARGAGPRQTLPVDEVGSYLLAVAPAAVRARLHDELGAEVGAWRLARHRALLATGHRPADSPWYLARRVLAVLSARPREVREWLAAHPDLPVEIVLHGAKLDPETWWRTIGRPLRGPQGVRLEVVRRDTDTVVVVTEAGPASA